MGKRLEIVGHDGRRVQDGRALSGLHDWSRLPRLRLTGVDSGVQRGRQQAVVVETPLVVPERLLSERGRHAARQRGHLRRRRVEAEGVGNARLLVLVVGACIRGSARTASNASSPVAMTIRRSAARSNRT